MPCPNSVAKWLSEVGLSQYAEILHQHEFDTLEAVAEIALEDLMEMGIRRVGARRKFLISVKALKATLSKYEIVSKNNIVEQIVLEGLQNDRNERYSSQQVNKSEFTDLSIISQPQSNSSPLLQRRHSDHEVDTRNFSPPKPRAASALASGHGGVEQPSPSTNVGATAPPRTPTENDRHTKECWLSEKIPSTPQILLNNPAPQQETNTNTPTNPPSPPMEPKVESDTATCDAIQLLETQKTNELYLFPGSTPREHTEVMAERERFLERMMEQNKNLEACIGFGETLLKQQTHAQSLMKYSKPRLTSAAEVALHLGIESESLRRSQISSPHKGSLTLASPGHLVRVEDPSEVPENMLVSAMGTKQSRLITRIKGIAVESRKVGNNKVEQKLEQKRLVNAGAQPRMSSSFNSSTATCSPSVTKRPVNMKKADYQKMLMDQDEQMQIAVESRQYYEQFMTNYTIKMKKMFQKVQRDPWSLSEKDFFQDHEEQEIKKKLAELVGIKLEDRPPPDPDYESDDSIPRMDKLTTIEVDPSLLDTTQDFTQIDFDPETSVW